MTQTAITPKTLLEELTRLRQAIVDDSSLLSDSRTISLCLEIAQSLGLTIDPDWDFRSDGLARLIDDLIAVFDEDGELVQGVVPANLAELVESMEADLARQEQVTELASRFNQDDNWARQVVDQVIVAMEQQLGEEILGEQATTSQADAQTVIRVAVRVAPIVMRAAEVKKATGPQERSAIIQAIPAAGQQTLERIAQSSASRVDDARLKQLTASILDRAMVWAPAIEAATVEAEKVVAQVEDELSADIAAGDKKTLAAQTTAVVLKLVADDPQLLDEGQKVSLTQATGAELAKLPPVVSVTITDRQLRETIAVVVKAVSEQQLLGNVQQPLLEERPVVQKTAACHLLTENLTQDLIEDGVDPSLARAAALVYAKRQVWGDRLDVGSRQLQDLLAQRREGQPTTPVWQSVFQAVNAGSPERTTSLNQSGIDTTSVSQAVSLISRIAEKLGSKAIGKILRQITSWVVGKIGPLIAKLIGWAVGTAVTAGLGALLAILPIVWGVIKKVWGAIKRVIEPVLGMISRITGVPLAQMWSRFKGMLSPSGFLKGVGQQMVMPTVLSGAALAGILFLAIVGPIVLVFFTIITVGGAFWTSADRGPSPSEAGIYLNEVAPDGSHLAVFVQRKMEECGARVFTRENSISVGNCLIVKGVDRDVVFRMTESAQRFGVLQCVGFVKAVDPRFIGSGDAYSYAINYPAGWGKVDFYLDGSGKVVYPSGRTIGVGDMVVWGPNKDRCPGGGSCDRNISCCGHIGAITAVKDTSVSVPGGKTILYVTQAFGNDGTVMTNAIDLNDQSGYTIIGFGKGSND